MEETIVKATAAGGHYGTMPNTISKTWINDVLPNIKPGYAPQMEKTATSAFTCTCRARFGTQSEPGGPANWKGMPRVGPALSWESKTNSVSINPHGPAN